jgi:hypothetical protein
MSDGVEAITAQYNGKSTIVLVEKSKKKEFKNKLKID